MLKLLNSLRETIDKLEVKHLKVRREYASKEFDILTSFDFKKEYGKDNEKIRREHIRRELKELAEKKDEYYLELEAMKRAYECLKLEIEMGGA